MIESSVRNHFLVTDCPETETFTVVGKEVL